MAKKRASTGSHAPRSRGKASDESGWKKSKLLAVVLVLVIVWALYSIISGGDSGGSRLPKDFPRTFIAEQDNGNYEAVLIERGEKSPVMPIVKDGKQYWEAYICMNEHCPGRAKTPDKKPYVFASVVPEMPPQPANPEGEPPMEYIHFEVACPLCKDQQAKVQTQYKVLFDPQNIARYTTPEAEEMINKMREEFRKKNN